MHIRYGKIAKGLNRKTLRNIFFEVFKWKNVITEYHLG